MFLCKHDARKVTDCFYFENYAQVCPRKLYNVASFSNGVSYKKQRIERKCSSCGSNTGKMTFVISKIRHRCIQKVTQPGVIEKMDYEKCLTWRHDLLEKYRLLYFEN